MSTSNQKFVKGVVVKNDADLTKQIEISVANASTTNTKTILQSSQTANRTITLPDSTDTLSTVGDLNAHIGMLAAAHDASAIDNTPLGNLIATDVQGALNELQGDVDSRVPDSRTVNGQALTSDITLTTDNVQESGTPTNLYFTVSRAKTAAVADAIVDAVTDVAPSQNAVFDALAGKEPSITIGTTGDYFRGDKSFQPLNKAAVSLGNVDNVQQMPLSYLDTDGTLAANSDSKVATQKAVKEYADSIAAGLNPKASVRAASTVDIGGSYATTPSNGQFTGAATALDGVTLANNDRVLLKNQTDAKQNGIYVYNGSGQFTRSADMDGSPAAEVASGDFVFVVQGSTYAATNFVLVGNGLIALNTDNLNWTQSSGTGVGGANTTLSNLTSPTSINQNLVPDTDLTKKLGDFNKAYTQTHTSQLYTNLIETPTGGAAVDILNRRLYDNTSTWNFDYATYPKVLSEKSQLSGGAASAPSGNERDVYYNSTTKTYSYYNGTAWVLMSNSDVQTTKGDLAGYSTSAARVPVGSDGQVLTADSTAALGLSYQPAMAKNYIINSAFDIWQRSTDSLGSTNSTAEYKAADRFWQARVGASATNMRQTQVAGTNSRYAMQIRRVTSASDTSRLMTGYTLESNDAIRLSGKEVTLSFWAKKGANYSEASSQLTVQYVTGTGIDEGTQTGAPFLSGGWTGRLVTAFSPAALTTTLTRFSYTFTVASGTKELLFAWSFVPVGTAGADDSFTLENIMLNEGSMAMPFQTAGANYQQELAMCKRYFRTIGFGAGNLCNGADYLDGTNINFVTPCDVKDMRINPTPALVGIANTDYAVSNTRYTPQTGFTFSLISMEADSLLIGTAKTSHGLTNSPTICIRFQTTSGGITLSAEL